MTELFWHALIISTCLPGAALAAAWLLRGASADLRHRILAASLLALLLFPVMLVALPSWTIAILPAVDTSALDASLRPESSATSWLAIVWLAGLLTGLAHLTAGWLTLHSVRKRGMAPSNPEWNALALRLAGRLGIERPVALQVDARIVTPMTWGTLRPVVALPRCADHWNRGTRETVLAHEFAHVARRDALMTLLVQAVCALYWFQPLVWLARRRLRLEQELASDDVVLACGGRASAYAGHLLQLARNRQRPIVLDAAVAVIGRRSQLEQRLHAVLAPNTAHHGPGRPGLAWALALMLAAIAAGVRPGRELAPRTTVPYSMTAPVVVRAASESVPEPPPAEPRLEAPAEQPAPPRRSIRGEEHRVFLYTSTRSRTSSSFATGSARTWASTSARASASATAGTR